MDGNEDQAAMVEKGFGLRMGFGVRPALIVVDLLKAFTDPALPLGSKLDDEVAATARLMEAAHRADIPVILATVTYHGGSLDEAGIWSLKQKGSSSLLAGTGGSDFDARLPVTERDQVLQKKYASCFFGTDLVSRLVSRRVDTLIVTGCSTSGCVRATTVDALQNGFRPMVVREAVGDRNPSAHAQSLLDIDAKYGDVVGLAETIAYLDASARPARQ